MFVTIFKLIIITLSIIKKYEIINYSMSLCNSVIEVTLNNMGEYSSRLWFLRLLRIIKITGFSTFSVENGEVVLKFVDILCFSISFGLGIVISSNSLLHLEINLSANDFIVIVGNQLATNSAILIAIISMLMSLIFRKRNWKLMMTFHESDLKVFTKILL